jgi:hypothetical protein
MEHCKQWSPSLSNFSPFHHNFNLSCLYLLRLNLKTKGEPHLELKISSLQEICEFLGYYAASSGNFLPIGTIGCPETSRSHHYSLSNSPEERSFQLLRGGSPKSRKVAYNFLRASHDSIRRHFDYDLSVCDFIKYHSIVTSTHRRALQKNLTSQLTFCLLQFLINATEADGK